MSEPEFAFGSGQQRSNPIRAHTPQSAEPPAEPEAATSGEGKSPPLTREAIARAARASSPTPGQIEKIQKTATPKLVSAVKAGVISITAAVASLPEEKQVAAVAGGKKELRKVAHQVPEARLPPRLEAAPPPNDAPPEYMEIHRPTMRLAELTEERDQLKKKVQHLTIALGKARGGK